MEIHNINPDYLTAILLGSSKIVYESFLKIVIKLGGAQRRSGPSPDHKIGQCGSSCVMGHKAVRLHSSGFLRSVKTGLEFDVDTFILSSCCPFVKLQTYLTKMVSKLAERILCKSIGTMPNTEQVINKKFFFFFLNLHYD